MKFKLIFIVVPIAMLLTACNDSGMEAYLTVVGEIKCVPK